MKNLLLGLMALSLIALNIQVKIYLDEEAGEQIEIEENMRAYEEFTKKYKGYQVSEVNYDNVVLYSKKYDTIIENNKRTILESLVRTIVWVGDLSLPLSEGQLIYPLEQYKLTPDGINKHISHEAIPQPNK